MAANTTANTAKVAAPRKRAARKAVSAPQTVAETAPVTLVDPDVYVAPTGLTDGFVSNGKGPALDRLTPRALENLTELATEGNTDAARRYWIRRLSQYGVTVPFVSVDASE